VRERRTYAGHVRKPEHEADGVEHVALPRPVEAGDRVEGRFHPAIVVGADSCTLRARACVSQQERGDGRAGRARADEDQLCDAHGAAGRGTLTRCGRTDREGKLVETGTMERIEMEHAHACRDAKRRKARRRQEAKSRKRARRTRSENLKHDVDRDASASGTVGR
jgi:hypothetical protein